MADDRARREAFSCLKELRLERASLIVGVGATLRYFVEYNELRQEGEPSKPAICPISDEAMSEVYLWQKRIEAGIHPDERHGST